ncbi:MAG: MFS transporter, partial [Lentisphaerota bacterium]
MDSNNNLRVIVVSAIGGVLEYYDFVVFILFANIISQVFFPAHESEYLALAATYTFFAVGYFVRPIGGIILAHFGDRYGRKKIFLLTVFLMAIPTFLIGLIPTYASIGLIAPILLLLMRICQGLAMGGEIPGSSVFVYEHMTRNLKCSGISYLIAGLFGGILLGSIIGSIITKSLSNESLMVWGWRIPFLLGGLLGVVGMYLRSKLTETPIFMDIQKHNKQPKMPIGEILKNHKWSVIAGICTTLALASTVTTYY